MANENIKIDVDIVGNISQFQNSISQIQGQLSKLKMPSNLKDSFDKTFSNIEQEINKINNLTANGKELKLVDTKAVQNSLSKISQSWYELQRKLSSQGFKTNIKLDGIEKIQQAANSLEIYRQHLKESRQQLRDLKNEEKDLINNAQSIAKSLNVANSAQGLADAKEKLKALEEEYKNAKQAVVDFKAANKNITLNTDGTISVANLKGDVKEKAQEINIALKSSKQAFQEYKNNVTLFDNANTQIIDKGKELTDALKNNKTELSAELVQLKQTFQNELNQLASSSGVQIDWSKPLNAKRLSETIAQLTTASEVELQKVLTNFLQLANNGSVDLSNLEQHVDTATDSLNNMGKTSDEIDQLFNSFGRIFSLTSGVQLFRKAIKSAISTIKELDSVMTEVAVVTDFSVSDMWEQLPEYTKNASELGVATKNMYEAAALYYQQGLKTSEVNAMVTSTLKMARIASLDASTATDRMTNAMRGFNMEINETNAEHVADVYSNLAAKSASNVDELSTAMTKTASIASSANMSFENTAAFLAQGIETTRESADTIGTMLKTVIGRFTEVKEAYNIGDLVADSEDGEIEVNKVATALKTAGINLNEFFTGAKGLDEIFIELSSKWNDLDLITQRYIATQAAGSRQQSRFIALMQDYSRQQELIGYAYDSAGASEAQYEKTLDSLESKLNQLSNAWNDFTMGIANSSVIKAAVDGLTGLLNVLNSLTSSLGTTGGTIAKLSLAIGGFFTGKALFKTFKTGFKEMFKSAALGVSEDQSIGQKFTTVFSNLFRHGTQSLSKQLKDSLSNLNWSGDTFRGFNSSFNRNIVAMSQDAKAQFSAGLNGIFTDKGLQLNPSDLNSWDSFRTKIKQANISASELNDAITRLREQGVSIPMTDIQKFQQKCMAASMVCGTLSMALGGISTALSNAGFSEASEVCNDLSKALGIVAVALMVLPPILDKLKIKAEDLQTAFIWVAVIAAAATAAYIIIKKLLSDNYKASLEGRLEAANEKLEELSTAAENAKSKFEDLKSSVESIQDARSSLDDLTEGTDEWKEAVLELNQQVMTLISSYPELAEAVKNVDGVLELDTDSDAYKNFYKQQIADIYTTANAQTAQQVQTNKLSSEKNQKDTIEDIGENNIDYYGRDSGLVGNTNKTRDEYYTEELYQAYKEAIKSLDQTGENFDFKKFVTKWAQENPGVLKTSQGNIDETYFNFEQVEQKFQKIQASELSDSTTNDALRQQLINNAATQVSMQLDDYTYSTALSNAFSPDMITDVVEASTLEYSDQVLRDYYAVQGMTITIDGNKINTYDSQGALQEEDLEVTDVMKEAALEVAKTSEASEAVTQKMTILSEYFSQNTDNSSVMEIADALAGNISISDLSKDSFQDYLDSLDGDIIVALENMGIDVVSVIQENAEAIKNNTIKTTKATAKESTKYMSLNTRQASDLGTNYANMVIKFDESGLDFNTFMGDFNTKVNATYGSQAKSLAQTTMNNLISSEDIDGMQAYSEWFESVDLSNPIDGYNDLAAAVGSANDVVSGFAKKLLETNNSDFDFSSQFEYLSTLGDEFTDATEEIDDLIESEGEINAENIQSVIDKSSNLNKVMKNASLTAEGMARIINMIGNGNASFNNISDAAIAAAQNIGLMQSKIDEAIETLSDFDAGTDEGEAAEKLGSIYEDLNEKFENGEYGNSQLYNTLKFLYGDSFSDAIGENGENLINAEEQYLNRLKTISENGNMLSEWQNLIGENEGFTVFESENGLELIFDNSINSIDGYIDAIAEATGYTKEYAKLMLADWKNYSTDFAQVWDDLEKEDAYKAAAKELHTNSSYYLTHDDKGYHSIHNTETSGKTVISKSQVEQISEVTGDDFETVLQNLGLNSDNTITVGFEFTTEGIDTDVSQTAEEIVESLGSEFAQSFMKGNVIDYEALSAEVDSWGLDQDVADKVKEGILQGAAENDPEVKVRVEQEDGTFEEVTITADVEIDNLQNLAEQVKTDEITSAMSAAIEEGIEQGFADLGNIEINTVVSEDGIEAVEEQLIKIGQEQFGVDYSVTDLAVSNIKGKLAEAGKDLSAEYNAVISGNGTITIGEKNIPVTLSSQASGGSIKKDIMSLTGEEGAEIIWGNGTARIVGQDGPEFTQLHAGEHVFNASQTKKILNNSKKNKFGSFSNGTKTTSYGAKIGSYTSSSEDAASAAESASEAASSASEAADVWVNTLDKLYNLVELIEEETRRRELLEKQYERLLKNQDLTISEVRENYQDQMSSLLKSLEYQESLQSGRLVQINAVASERYEQDDTITTYAATGATSYARYNQSTNTIEIDWDRIDAITDKNLGEAVEAYISRLEELQDQYEDTQSELYEIEDQIDELNEIYREEYKDFSQRIYDALVNQEQTRIDNLSELYDQIESDNSEILDDLREQIDLQRQIRDNTDTEREIADKENQLAYLRRDTSNANLLNIKKLEDEIQTLRDDYRDTLIDQKLEALSDDNEKAAAQRDKQIEQLNDILKYNEEHGTYWETVESLITAAFNADGTLNNNSELVALLKTEDMYDAMSAVSGKDWMLELASAFQVSAEGLEQFKVENATDKALEDINNGVSWDKSTGVTLANGATVHYNPETGKWSTGVDDEWGWDLSYDVTTGQYSNINGERVKAEETPNNSTPRNYWATGTATSTDDYVNVRDNPNGNVVRQLFTGQRFEVNGETQDGWVRVRVQHNGRDDSEGWDYGWIYQNWVKYDRFKEGGLANFTGPAWLDGTKSHPELVLNAQDTENFLKLRDILSESLKSTNTTNSTKYGDNYFEISINVDEIGSDYDVEQLTEKIKNEIKKDSMYRNVNTLNFLR